MMSGASSVRRSTRLRYDSLMLSALAKSRTILGRFALNRAYEAPPSPLPVGIAKNTPSLARIWNRAAVYKNGPSYTLLSERPSELDELQALPSMIRVPDRIEIFRLNAHQRGPNDQARAPV